jgi:hypothetical protein
MASENANSAERVLSIANSLVNWVICLIQTLNGDYIIAGKNTKALFWKV